LADRDIRVCYEDKQCFVFLFLGLCLANM